MDQEHLVIKNHNRMTIYHRQFSSMAQLEQFLSSNPPINKKVFYTLSSETNPVDFAGAPLREAIGYLLGGYKKGFREFLELKSQLESSNVKKIPGRKVEPAVVGFRPNVPGYVAGSPKTMYRMAKTEEKKVIDIYMNLSYPAVTTDAQIFNRGVLVLNLISLLENNNYLVNFRVFQSSYCEDEVFFTEIVLKRPDELLNISKCFYPMCGKEFLRRVLARVLEVTPVKRNWVLSYGMMMNEAQNRSVLKIPEKAIVILSPMEMGIKGYDLYGDADNFLKKLKLSDKIRVPRYKS